MAQEAKNQEKGPKFHLDIEGVLKPWDKDTITTDEIIALGVMGPVAGRYLDRQGQ